MIYTGTCVFERISGGLQFMFSLDPFCFCMWFPGTLGTVRSLWQEKKPHSFLIFTLNVHISKEIDIPRLFLPGVPFFFWQISFQPIQESFC